ncbi:MAG: NADPH-dependent 7-cyano-7-deazaguanine reductase QueF [Pseudomonadota bacterium]
MPAPDVDESLQASVSETQQNNSVQGGFAGMSQSLKHAVQPAADDLAGINADIQVSESPLGKSTEYPDKYTPSLLHPLSRSDARAALGLQHLEQMRGEDVWTAYEFSWLNSDGKPLIAGLRLHIPCHSVAMVESKSLKLYLNSYAQTRFETQAEVLNTLDQDLSQSFQSPVMVELFEIQQLGAAHGKFPGICLDEQDVVITTYERDPDLLVLDPDKVNVKESCYTDLFRSLCPVTAQPDWASISIEYAGPAIDRGALLKYLVSYRNHQAFHETTIEQIFSDILEYCAPTDLSVYGRFVRRGGLDINPFRSTSQDTAPALRLARQ